MSGVQTCQWEPTKVVAVADGGLDLAARWFGMDEAAVEAKARRFARGKRAGQLRGWVVYRKVRVGGWSFKLNGVLKPGMMFAHFATTYDDANDFANRSTDEFMACATRVDTAYGHDPVRTRAEAVERKAAAVTARQTEQDERDALYDLVVASFEQPFYDAMEGETRQAMIRFTMSRPVSEIKAVLGMNEKIESGVAV